MAAMFESDVIASLNGVAMHDAPGLFRAGIAALNADYADALLPIVRRAVKHHPRDGRLWQLLGLAARAAQISSEAADALARASVLIPDDPLIAHSHARTHLEAGRPSVALFNRARQLAPDDSSVLTGRAAAQYDEGQADQAVADLEALLRQNPLWTDGHATIASLYAQMGMPPAAAIDAALSLHPDAPSLHQQRIALHAQNQDHVAIEAALTEANQRLASCQWLDEMSADAASERGAVTLADQLYTALGEPVSAVRAHRHARHLLRAGRADAAARLSENWIGRDPQGLMWPYLSLAWRIIGDPRWDWLENDSHFVGIYDVADRLDDIEGLAALLRTLHRASDAPLDQSVRGGTQTDGNLLLREQPLLQQLRSVILDVVADHVAQLPPSVAGHPLLLDHRAPLRFAGSWSVRLARQGFHSDHVHSQGWISSAFYVALPDAAMGSGNAESSYDGWFSLGECRELCPDLAPLRIIEPKVGRLVLFPSTQWHGTRPFQQGERMTVAFDIARPRQG